MFVCFPHSLPVRDIEGLHHEGEPSLGREEEGIRSGDHLHIIRRVWASEGVGCNDGVEKLVIHDGSLRHAQPHEDGGLVVLACEHRGGGARGGSANRRCKKGGQRAARN